MRMIFNAAGIAPIKGLLRSMGAGDRKTVDLSEGDQIDDVQLADILARTSSTL